MARAREIGWVRDHLADLESDFSRFHRVDDIYAMDGARFMRLAWRIAAYDGMMSRRIEAQNHKPPTPSAGKGGKPGPRRSAERAVVSTKATQGAQVVPAAAFSMQFPGLIERSRKPKHPDDN